MKKGVDRKKQLLAELMRLRTQLESVTEEKSNYSQNLRQRMKIKRIKKRVLKVSRDIEEMK